MPRAKQLTMKLKMPPTTTTTTISSQSLCKAGCSVSSARQLSQVSLLYLSLSRPSPFPILTHVLRPFVPLLWPGRRKEVPERTRALPQSKCLPRVRAPKVQQEGGREEGRRRRHIEYRSIWARVQTLRSCARHKNPMTLH